MLLAKVLGTVVSTEKDPKVQGRKLLLIQPQATRPEGLVATGASLVAVDVVGAGPGSLVLFTQGSSARLTEVTRETPVDTVIVGIVDAVQMDGRPVEAR
jgi:ethanolamine utilization protein EutN